MNERIRQLAEQAGGYVSLSYDYDGKLILSGEDNIQKFAELIVQECAKIADTAEPFLYSDLIKKHFGVEE